MIFRTKRRFLPKFKIFNSKNEIGSCKPINIWKYHFKLKLEGQSYEMVQHKKHKVSIFKEDQQVAWFDKQAVSWFNGVNYTLICDDDQDPSIMALILMIWDDLKSPTGDSNDNTITLDFGNIGSEAKKFDKNWKPKNLKQPYF
ncbi:hypothetical protein [Owenweeksia hongkongensis]|uniref:hypothetical protein n=1 Tax=Owenweeksia hongkongensis TaxID=253245 RepID=UPI003A8DD59D